MAILQQRNSRPRPRRGRRPDGRQQRQRRRLLQLLRAVAVDADVWLLQQHLPLCLPFPGWSVHGSMWMEDPRTSSRDRGRGRAKAASLQIPCCSISPTRKSSIARCCKQSRPAPCDGGGCGSPPARSRTPLPALLRGPSYLRPLHPHAATQPLRPSLGRSALRLIPVLRLPLSL